MIVARRFLFTSCLALTAMRTSVAAPSRAVDLFYAAGRLSWPAGDTRAACGRGGVRVDKREGDGASPAGTFPLLQVYYRADRLAPPRTALPIAPLRPNDGWVDDPADRQYNRLVTLPYPAHHEELWRADGLYDLVVVIGYNTEPPIAARGSAIFLHVASSEFAPTTGCIAVARDVLVGLLPLLGPGSRITIAD